MPNPASRAGLDVHRVRATNPECLLLLIAGNRALLRATTVEEVVQACSAVVRGLGGKVLPARMGIPEALPLDLSFGSGEPLLASADEADTRRVLESVLPDLLEDARFAVSSVRRAASLSHDATVDGLTGLLNRRAMDRILARLQPGDTLLMMDVDHFKQVNDQLGHAVGDLVLTGFARVLREQTRAADWVGRLGGDEFLVVMPRADVAAATRLVGRLRSSWLRVRPQPVTISAGLATAGDGGHAEALGRADKALYEDKASRRRPLFQPRKGVA